MAATLSGAAFDWKDIHDKAGETGIEAAKEAASNGPASVVDLYTLALVQLTNHQDQEAKNNFLQIIEMDKDNFAAKWGLAEVARRQHEIEESQKLLDGVFKVNKEFPPALITQAYIYYTKRDFDAAVNAAKKVLAQGRDEVDVDNYVRAKLMIAGAKGMIAHFGGPLSKAINGMSVKPNLRAAEKIRPNSPEVLYGLGSFYLLAPDPFGGDIEKAEDYLNKAIQADPLFVDAYVRLAQLYKVKGDKTAYEEYLEKALDIDPQNQMANDIKSGECNFICL